MTQTPPPRKFGSREYLGGFGALFFFFGIVTFLMGSAVPWGFQQVGGLIAAIIGIVLMFVRATLPRR
jgi:hypothetical protein